MRQDSAGSAWRRRLLPLAGAALLAGVVLRGAAAPLSAKPGEAVFSGARPRQVSLEISPENVQRLRDAPRQYVQATWREQGLVLREVGVHLKGSSGSFRTIDEKASLTVSFDRFHTGQTWFGLEKVHLNNSVEDPSFFNEKLGEELFKAAGVPAPRAAWALVELNGRRLGLYVLKEGFTEGFLRLHFRDATGNLYEGSGFDLDGPLPRDAGRGPYDRADLKKAAALVETDGVKRWTRATEVLDMERFISFMAAEIMVCHRDGYCLARNNYRVYQDPAAGKLVFLPHGQDQLFGRADAPIEPRFIGLAATVVAGSPEGRRRYRERLGYLVTNVFDVPALEAKLDQWAAQIRPALARSEARAFDAERALLKQRLRARRASVCEQLARPEPKPIEFNGGVAVLTNWNAVDAPPGGRMEKVRSRDGRPALIIEAGPMTMASWRGKALLPPGRYRFEARAATEAVAAIGFGKTHGVGLRVGGRPRAQPVGLLNDQPWTRLQAEFEVKDAPEEVELICELRARQGTAWFDLDSLRLTRLD